MHIFDMLNIIIFMICISNNVLWKPDGKNICLFLIHLKDKDQTVIKSNSESNSEGNSEGKTKVSCFLD